MIKIVGVMLGLVLAFLIYIYYKKVEDFFDPSVLFLILEFIAYVPGMFLFTSESSVEFTVSGCMTVFIYEILYVGASLIGISVAKRICIGNKERTLDIPLLNIFIFSDWVWCKNSRSSQIGWLCVCTNTWSVCVYDAGTWIWHLYYFL